MRDAEQMAKDYEPPKPHNRWSWRGLHHICWGERFEDFAYRYKGPTRGEAVVTGAQLTELEKRARADGFATGYASALEGIKDDIDVRLKRIGSK